MQIFHSLPEELSDVKIIVFSVLVHILLYFFLFPCLCPVIVPFSAIEVARLCIPIGKGLHIGWQDFATMMAGVLKPDAELHLQVSLLVTLYEVVAGTHGFTVLISSLPELGKK